jgi:putative transposase
MLLVVDAISAIKSVNQNYSPSEHVLLMLEDFRRMVNDCIRIGLENNLTSTQSLSMKAYHELKGYGLPAAYRLTAVTKAVAILKNHRKALRKGRAKRPHAAKRMVTDCYLFRIIDGKRRISLGRRRYEFIPLNDHVLHSIQGFAVRSVSLTVSTLSLAFSKEVVETAIKGLIGLDRNLDNVTTATLDGKTIVYDLSQVTRIKAVYREIKSHFRRDDARIQKKICGKYGRKQRDRVHQRLHLVSKAIVTVAKAT